MFHSERHQKAEERFRQLEEAGAPPDTLCSLCHLEENETVVYDHPEDGVEVRLPLGRLLLVRTSTITHAWVHFECGRWCPEVRPTTPHSLLCAPFLTCPGLSPRPCLPWPKPSSVPSPPEYLSSPGAETLDLLLPTLGWAQALTTTVASASLPPPPIHCPSISLPGAP